MIYNTTEIITLLKSSITENRFNHSIGVANCAKELSERFNCDINKAYLSGILHDCSTYLTGDEMISLAEKIGIKITMEARKDPVSVLHAELSAYIAEQKYGIDDMEILQAIAYHSSGGINMTALDKIISLADAIEPSREGSEIDRLRIIAESDLDEAFLEKYSLYMINTISSRYNLSIKKTEVYNYLLLEKEMKGRT
jgi:predicted HD superfamily hydrolase involved in NAD metabolism